ncbi:hypothetical protein [Massilia litorea]|jgi:hypothetical protein|uniref:Uncharacterized protein n=1 Tax=Massilia litorea TaxID=2769491 RepID=A0A7L9TZV6_9BURK|nr:hypothetical protein [Massilia litorea]QOL48323.1 hypothetical protein LPB04_15210 [Massilia litorea]
MTAPLDTPPRFRPRPWIHLETPQDVELWIAEHDQALQDLIKPQETGYGVCFTLAEGGNIYLQTHEDAIQLDVDDEASWVAPLIVAATGAEIPRGSYWLLPADRLVQLVIGLSSLVASTTLVVGHRFGSRGQAQAY